MLAFFYGFAEFCGFGFVHLQTITTSENLKKCARVCIFGLKRSKQTDYSCLDFYKNIKQIKKIVFYIYFFSLYVFGEPAVHFS